MSAADELVEVIRAEVRKTCANPSEPCAKCEVLTRSITSAIVARYGQPEIEKETRQGPRALFQIERRLAFPWQAVDVALE